MRRVICTTLIAITFYACSAAHQVDRKIVSKKEIIAAIPEDQKEPIEDKVRFCRNEKEKMQAGLTAAYHRYQMSKAPKPMQLLIELDRNIRSLMKQRPAYRPCNDDRDIYDPKWQELGVHLGYWSDVVYTGDLLYRAHQRDPHSSFRRYTLFSTIMGVQESRQLALMPNIQAAFQYAQEFPQGPFIEDTHWIIAGFYKDLFMVLRDALQDYKYNCFKPYIDKMPRQIQTQRAKSKAIASYQTILTLNPANTKAAELLGELQRGTIKAWSFCAD